MAEFTKEKLDNGNYLIRDSYGEDCGSIEFDAREGWMVFFGGIMLDTCVSPTQGLRKVCIYNEMA